MKTLSVQSVPHLAWPRSTENSSANKPNIPNQISVKTVSPNKADFEHAGLGLGVQTTRMLGKLATYLEDNPSAGLVIREYRNDTNKADLNPSKERTNLVKAYLDTRGIDVSRFVIIGSRTSNRWLPKIPLGTELMIEVIRNSRLQR